uniref:Neurotactinlike [Tribolium castaneum] n=1 Tax=Lepeophtheirus salmonis TaxID=72036 RepID=A0A0K2VHE0_LEPSM
MPVVVYIRGDDESESLAPSSELSKNMSVVFVEVNYRLGTLGFLSNDVLSKRSYPHTSGNYGLGDIITALKWVSLNIQHFGGHPKKVTLLGSGFGATLVTALTSSRLGKGFYSGIWVSNGAGSFANRTLEQVSVENEKIVKKLFCGPDKERCLINADAEVLTENIPDEWLTSSTSQLPQIGEKEYSWIVVDKHILTHHPVSYWINHASEIDVPMVFGSTEHVEATEKNINLMDWDDRDVFEAHVEEKLGSFNVTLPGLALSFYNTSDNWIDYISMLSDIRTVCPIMNLAEMASANSNKNVYSYIATQTRVGDLGNIADAHSDISAIFGLYEPKNSTEIRFVTNIQKLFYKFVKSGSLPYGNRDVALGYYDVNARVSFKHEPRSTCQFWENANYIVPEYANLD